MVDFNPIIVLFLTSIDTTVHTSSCNFNPIIVLFLTINFIPNIYILNFNPIIVLFLTCNIICIYGQFVQFQSYYSLIFNASHLLRGLILSADFNPIIVLFLTMPIANLIFQVYNFNPIIVLFLTNKFLNLSDFVSPFQSYYSLIFNHII